MSANTNSSPESSATNNAAPNSTEKPWWDNPLDIGILVGMVICYTVMLVSLGFYIRDCFRSRALRKEQRRLREDLELNSLQGPQGLEHAPTPPRISIPDFTEFDFARGNAEWCVTPGPQVPAEVHPRYGVGVAYPLGSHPLTEDERRGFDITVTGAIRAQRAPPSRENKLGQSDTLEDVDLS
ncbi:hypothetical protein AAE478_000047 [Parahypoxylon ruwenzoriense]